MRRFMITLMVVTMAFTAAAQALAPTSAVGGYGLSASVTYKKLGDGTWEYGYDIFAENHWLYYDYFVMKFGFGDGGTVDDHVLNLYDTGVRLEHREFWTVQGITGNHGGEGWYSEIQTGVQASFGDRATDTWIINPSVADAIFNAWVIDPIYALAEGIANPFHVPSDYAHHIGSPWHPGGGAGDAAFGVHAGIRGDTTGGPAYTPSSEDLLYDMDWFFGGHIFDGWYIGPELMATFRVVSDLAPYGETDFQTISSGSAFIGPIMGPALPTVGDFDGNGVIDDIDIDLLGDAIRTGSVNFALFDISTDGTTDTPNGVIDCNDVDYLVHYLVETTIGLGTEYGDFNLDGIIDTTDLTRLATFFGVGIGWAEGNANGCTDITVDTTDLTILATFFGFDASVDVIPEPATMTLLALGGLAALRRRRR